MRKIFYIAAIVALAISCAKEIDNGTEAVSYVQKEYVAEMEDGTKTSIDAGKVSWSQGDVIRYYSKKNGTVGNCTIAESGASAPLTMDVASDASFLIAVYGGESITANTSGSAFTLNGAVKAEQSGKFADAHVSLVKTYDVNQTKLTFSNVTSLVKFTLTRSDISYITFASNDNTAIHGNGAINFSFSDEAPSASLGSPADNSIKVNIGSAGTFYISMLPTTLQSGFTIKCYDFSGTYIGEVGSNKTFELNKNAVLDLGILDSRIHDVSKPVIVYKPDLSENGTANCYIIPVKGEYYFDATVKGSSSEKISGVIAKAYTVWESFGTDVKPVAGDIVKDVHYEDGKVYFTATGKNGNAVIAIDNRDEEIVWSWHIWCCMDYDADFYAQNYNNGAGTMMDRNLGATSAVKGDLHALGLLYQWGRKDPFLGGCSISYTTHSNQAKAASTITWPKAVYSNSSNGTIAYAVANPTTFIMGDTNNHDWHYHGSIIDNTLWQTSNSAKGIYDPCPVGYRVPSGEDSGIWSKAFGTSNYWTTVSNWDNTNKGMDFGSTDKTLGPDVIWYPASGYLGGSSGDLYDVGSFGYYCSCTPNDDDAFFMYFDLYGCVLPLGNFIRDYGRSVRCQKIQ